MGILRNEQAIGVFVVLEHQEFSALDAQSETQQYLTATGEIGAWRVYSPDDEVILHFEVANQGNNYTPAELTDLYHVPQGVLLEGYCNQLSGATIVVARTRANDNCLVWFERGFVMRS